MPPMNQVSRQSPPKPTSPSRPKTTTPTKTGSVLDRIAPIEFEDQGLKMLVYGASGSGKTTFAGTFPGPILWVVCSGGKNPGELRSLDTPELRKKVRQVALQKSDELDELVRHIEETGSYNTVVLDHASGFADLVLGEIAGKRVPEQKGWGDFTQQQYGKLGQLCKDHFRDLLNLKGNVIFIAHERTFGGRDDGMDADIIRPTVGAALTPSIAGWLAGGCDYVVQAFKRPKMVPHEAVIGGKKHVTMQRGKGVEYCLRTEPHDTYSTKFRMPMGRELPDCIVDPSFDKVMEIIREE